MDMEEMLKAAQQAAEKIQQQMNDVQVTLDSLEVEGTSGGGLVKIRATAKGRILSVSIDDSLIVPEDKQMLQDLVTAAFNDARTLYLPGETANDTLPSLPARFFAAGASAPINTSATSSAVGFFPCVTATSSFAGARSSVTPGEPPAGTVTIFSSAGPVPSSSVPSFWRATICTLPGASFNESPSATVLNGCVAPGT